MPSFTPASLNIDNITDAEPEYLKIVRSEKEFCKNTYFWGLITYSSRGSSRYYPINTFLESTVQTQYSPVTNQLNSKLGDTASYTSSASLTVVNKFLEYYNTPLKIISCSDPYEYIYGIKVICDALFSHYINNVGKQSSMYKYTHIITELISSDDIKNEKFFENDDGSLSSYISKIQSYMVLQFKPSKFSLDYTDELKGLIYACYYPYFIFSYILSFITSENVTSNRPNITFIDIRKAKLALYLFVAHISSILNTILQNYTAIGTQDSESYAQKRTLLEQIMGNVSLNILGRESQNFETNKERIDNQLSELSKSNVDLNKTILSENDRYERYKQNLISSANVEKSVEKQFNNAKLWKKIHLILLILLIVIIVIILLIPKKLIPNNYDAFALYIVCAIYILYALVRGLIGVIKMLK